MALALAICRCYDYAGTLAEFVRARKSRRLRVLEAGNLTQFLSKLPRYIMARRPDLRIKFLPYDDCSFDLIIHSDVLQNMPDPAYALSQCYRVLAPSGRCVFTVPLDLSRKTVRSARRVGRSTRIAPPVQNTL